jgi:hypothetical protein
MKVIMSKFRKFMKNVRKISGEVYRVGSKDGEFMKAVNKPFDDWENEQRASPALDCGIPGKDVDIQDTHKALLLLFLPED